MFSRILLPVDLAEPSSWAHALPVAQTLCRSFGATLTLANIVPDAQLMLEAQRAPMRFEEILAVVHAQLTSLAATIEGIGPVDCRIETGSIYAEILNVAERDAIDLIVLAAHRPAMRDFLLGSNASRVARHARCSVFIVRP